MLSGCRRRKRKKKKNDGSMPFLVPSSRQVRHEKSILLRDKATQKTYRKLREEARGWRRLPRRGKRRRRPSEATTTESQNVLVVDVADADVIDAKRAKRSAGVKPADAVFLVHVFLWEQPQSNADTDHSTSRDEREPAEPGGCLARRGDWFRRRHCFCFSFQEKKTRPLPKKERKKKTERRVCALCSLSSPFENLLCCLSPSRPQEKEMMTHLSEKRRERERTKKTILFFLSSPRSSFPLIFFCDAKRVENEKNKQNKTPLTKKSSPPSRHAFSSLSCVREEDKGSTKATPSRLRGRCVRQRAHRAESCSPKHLSFFALARLKEGKKKRRFNSFLCVFISDSFFFLCSPQLPARCPTAAGIRPRRCLGVAETLREEENRRRGRPRLLWA